MTILGKKISRLFPVFCGVYDERFRAGFIDRAQCGVTRGVSVLERAVRCISAGKGMWLF